MQYRSLILASVLLTAGGATAVLAGPDHGPRGVRHADTNGDGVVTVEELQARHAEVFETSDADGNGKLDVAEMQTTIMREHARRRVQALDTNGDGAVSAEEFQAPRRWHLSRMDRNGDGELERGEGHGGRGPRWADDDDHGDDERGRWHERRHHRD